MYSRGLKSYIVLNLFIILSVAMLLVDAVMVGIARRELLQSRLEEGQSLLIALGLSLNDDLSVPEKFSSKLQSILEGSYAGCVTVVNEAGNDVFSGGKNCGTLLQDEARKALASGEPSSSFAGTIKGIILPARKSLLVARPYFENNSIIGALAIELDLSGIYLALRDSQRIFLVYFAVNLLVFVLFGFYRFYRVILKPINRLVDTAEKFRDDDEFSFLSEKKSGEFHRLSHSLNKMLIRINRDREKLQNTISKLKDANLKLRKTQLEMVRTEKLASVGRLSAGIAHEIGNPIGIVIGYLDLLKRNSIAAEQEKDFIARIESEVSRVNAIIRQLLDFARQPSNEIRGEVSVHAVIREIADICRIQPMMEDITIFIEDKAEFDTIIATNGQLKQVLLNLMFNAADAIKSQDDKQEGGQIKIITANRGREGSEEERESVRIQVSDNGPGIGKENIENIFDPFYTTKDPGKGTGLGLSISFTIVENMGGIIEAANTEDGAVITVTLPLAHKSSTPKH